MSHLQDKDPKGPQTEAPEALPLLLLAAFPLIFWVFHGSLGTAIAAVVNFALLSLGAGLISSGRTVEARYIAARVARRPRLPRKLLGAAVLGFTAMVLAATHFPSWHMPMLFGAAGFCLSVSAFGIDPMRDKGFDDPRILAEQAVATALDETGARLDNLVSRVAEMREQDLNLRTQAVQGAVLRLVRTHASDPQEFAAFQRPLEAFLSVAENEVRALEMAWHHNREGAALHYKSRISALTDGFEARARKQRSTQDSDEFAFDADLLLDRMRENNVA